MLTPRHIKVPGFFRSCGSAQSLVPCQATNVGGPVRDVLAGQGANHSDALRYREDLQHSHARSARQDDRHLWPDTTLAVAQRKNQEARCTVASTSCADDKQRRSVDSERARARIFHGGVDDCAADHAPAEPLEPFRVRGETLPLLNEADIQPGDILLRIDRDGLKNPEEFKRQLFEKCVINFIKYGQAAVRKTRKLVTCGAQDPFGGGSSKTIHVALCVRAYDDPQSPMLIAESSGLRGVRVGPSSDGFHKVVRSQHPALAKCSADIVQIWIEAGFKYSLMNAITSGLKTVVNRNAHNTPEPSLNTLMQRTVQNRAPFDKAMCSEFVAAALALSEYVVPGVEPIAAFTHPGRVTPAELESLFRAADRYETLGVLRVPPRSSALARAAF
jgi:hypothetical protein